MDMPSRLTLRLAVERWPIAGSFAISRGAKTEAVVVVAESATGTARGRGECVPYARYGETVEGVAAAIEALRAASRPGSTAPRSGGDAARRGPQRARLRPVGSRGQARRPCRPASSPASPALAPRRPPPTRSRSARPRRWPPRPRGGRTGRCSRSSSAARRRSRRASPPCAPPRRRRRLIVDANEGWAEDELEANLAACAAAGVALVEQPLPAGRDALLGAASRGRCRSAPTRACMTARRSPRSPAATTPSTSSSTRPAA